ncbi:hypothetical protein NBRC116188_13490 [Oceaniserpentilla sp. 4NH20-0058]|uniref:thioredoxin domain-containing protein n=1 Tax=Oceaniserpentilla sp. 4NH20-0058 TaxID=3127660 RepID=UPI003103C183
MKSLVLLIALSLFTCFAHTAIPPISSNPSIEEWRLWQEKRPKAAHYLNGLSLSHSPYLLQHAENPINWKTWPSSETNTKLLFISIGYASCHWCHQMNEHTFSDELVAKVLNEHYESIKVDRDEHPNIDYHYLQIQQAVTGEGGWPISIIALPDGSPIWLSSFETANDLKKIALRLSRVWQVQPKLLISQANNIKKISKSNITKQATIDISRLILDSRDHQFFGKNGEVKFPDEADLIFMLNQYEHNPELKSPLIKHLNTLAQSPLHDGVNGGYYRYSTNRDWSVPHFEKMLYTQAQLLWVYSEAYMQFKNPLYKRVAQRIFNFLQNNMLNESGLYTTSINADWKNIEGGYYLWPKSILDELGITQNIAKINQDQYQYFGIAPQKQLKKLQNNREKPLEDTRGITGLNGLLLWAFTRAHRAGIPKSDNAAKSLAESLSKHSIKPTGVNRTCYNPSHCLAGNIDDLSYLTLGFSSYSEMDQSYGRLSKGLFIQLLVQLNPQDPFTIEDHETIAPLSAAIMSADLLKQAIPFEWLTTKTNSSSYHSQTKHYLSKYKIADFAKGHGILLGFVNESKAKISLTLEKGWHVNSHQPIQNYLKATYISGINSETIQYPEGTLIQVDFDDSFLSLYENITNIEFTPQDKKSNLTLNTQACSDSLCLPPESIPLIEGTFK